MREAAMLRSEEPEVLELEAAEALLGVDGTRDLRAPGLGCLADLLLPQGSFGNYLPK